MEKLTFLFKQLEIIDMKYRKLNELSNDKFNIFSILYKSSDEVNLHSKFIYELLNPHASHGQNRLFLKLFMNEIEINFNCKNASAFREKHNIDILLQSPNQSVIIENKINTQDHSNQLSKYYNKIKKLGYKEENIFLLYLTLFGEDANEKQISSKVINISYESNILNWIENCIKEVATFPTLRETLVQYRNLISKLTNQSQYKGFILEVKDFLLEDNNLKIMLKIESSIIEAKIEIQLNFWQELMANLNPYFKFKFYNSNGNFRLKNSVERYYKQKKNRKDFGIKYEVDKNLYFFIEIRDNIYYGFYFFDENQILDSQIDKLNEIETDWEDKTESVYWKYCSKKLDFENFNENIFDLIDEDSRQKDIKIISDKILSMIKKYNQI